MPAISTRHIQVNFLQSLLGFYLVFRGLTTAAIASRGLNNYLVRVETNAVR